MGREFAAIVTVEQRGGDVSGIEVCDVTHAVSERQKNASRADTKSQGVYPSTTGTVSIKDLLNIVNTTHQSILSEDVLEHFGEARPSNGYYSQQAKFSLKGTEDAKSIAKMREENNLLLESEHEANRPKVLFADAVSAAHTSILSGELAKLLKQNGVEIGQNRLFNWMREHGFLIRRQGTDYNMPTQRGMDLGLFEIKETVIAHSDGHTSVNKTPKVTGKGQQYFVNVFLAGKEGKSHE